MTKYDLILTSAEGQTEEGVCGIEKFLPNGLCRLNIKAIP